MKTGRPPGARSVRTICLECGLSVGNLGAHNFARHGDPDKHRNAIARMAETHRQNGYFNNHPVWLDHGFPKGRSNPGWGKRPRGNTGWREDLDHFVRSSWEANVARVLRYLGVEYDYEATVFDLGLTTYTPDFRIHAKLYLEVKGW